MPMVRSEWGMHGVRRLRPEVAVLIIVDVLSFSTAVDIATGRGAHVLPFPLGDRVAAQQAADKAGALLAARVGRLAVKSAFRPGRFSNWRLAGG
jgi:2-phosphosulfolactate phosphatase